MATQGFVAKGCQQREFLSTVAFARSGVLAPILDGSGLLLLNPFATLQVEGSSKGPKRNMQRPLRLSE